MIIDVHTHAVPERFIEYIGKNPGKLNASVRTEDGEMKYFTGAFSFRLVPAYYDVRARIAAMDERGIDIDLISVVPFLFQYDLPAEEMAAVTRLLNDSLAEMAAGAPERLRGLATVPMQDVGAACAELARAVGELGFRGVEIATNVNGEYYDEPKYLPFFKACEELGVFVLLHPNQPNREALNKYYLSNYIGNPMDTTICAARIVFGGVLKSCPKLKLVFVHGGGMIPYQQGRFAHGHAQRQEGREFIGEDDPVKYFDMLYMDIITHDADALAYLVGKHGAGKVLLGTDFPFDMQEYRPVELVRSLKGISERDKAGILGLNALEQLLAP